MNIFFWLNNEPGDAKEDISLLYAGKNGDFIKSTPRMIGNYST